MWSALLHSAKRPTLGMNRKSRLEDPRGVSAEARGWGRTSSSGDRRPVTTAHWASSTSRSVHTWLRTGCRATNSMAEAEQWAAGISGPAYAIDDETAIKVVHGTVEVVSEGRWKLLSPSRGHQERHCETPAPAAISAVRHYDAPPRAGAGSCAAADDEVRGGALTPRRMEVDLRCLRPVTDADGQHARGEQGSDDMKGYRSRAHLGKTDVRSRQGITRRRRSSWTSCSSSSWH
jgi:hypothetical protein